MTKKKIIVSVVSAVLFVALLVAIAAAIMLAPTLDSGEPTAFWDRTEGVYQLEYNILGDDSTMSTMVAKYLTDPVEVYFDGDNVTIVVTMNISADTDSVLSVMVNEQYVASEKCLVSSVGTVSVFELTTSKQYFTDTLTFKLKAGSMPFEPEFSVLMDIDGAILL